MRTRRSPRKQEILWRELGGTVGKPKPAEPKTVEEIETMWWISRRARNIMIRAAQKQKRDALRKAIKAGSRS
jgi:hypothetical protein